MLLHASALTASVASALTAAVSAVAAADAAADSTLHRDLCLCLRRHVRRRRSGCPVFILLPRYRLHRGRRRRGRQDAHTDEGGGGGGGESGGV